MQEYLSRTRLGAVMDHLGGTLAMLGVSMAFFILLWGVRLSAITAGAALFVMLMMLRERLRKKRLKRREAALRRRIGGELKMEKWLVAMPERAHFEAALLLAQCYPLTVEKTGENGAQCRLQSDGEKLLIACAQMPAGEKLSVQRVAAFQRQCVRCGAARGVLCAVGEMVGEARKQAEMPPRIVTISREKMIALSGEICPATDEQLIALGRRKHQGNIEKAFVRTALSPFRDRQYLLYGLLLTGMYLLTGAFLYLLPGCFCLVCMALCRALAEKCQAEEKL